MRDIVERLELQAFVADKTQSGMAPLFEECLDEINRLRERLAEADECNRRVSDGNEKLREALKPFAYYASLIPDDISDTCSASGTVGDLRAAAAAIRESGA